MPPLVVPTTVSSGLNSGSFPNNCPKTAIIMWLARCNRSVFRPFRRPLTRRSSETWPAVWHRHFSTSKRVTGETQSLLVLSDAKVSSRPWPRGLITPAATTATRDSLVFPPNSLNVAISVSVGPRFWLLSKPKHLTQCARKEKTAARKSADCHLKFSQRRFEIDKREQCPGGVFQIRLNGN